MRATLSRNGRKTTTRVARIRRSTTRHRRPLPPNSPQQAITLRSVIAPRAGLLLTPPERAYSCRDSNPRWGILQWQVTVSTENLRTTSFASWRQGFSHSKNFRQVQTNCIAFAEAGLEPARTSMVATTTRRIGRFITPVLQGFGGNSRKFHKFITTYAPQPLATRLLAIALAL